jgi:hypothetical protein
MLQRLLLIGLTALTLLLASVPETALAQRGRDRDDRDDRDRFDRFRDGRFDRFRSRDRFDSGDLLRFRLGLGFGNQFGFRSSFRNNFELQRLRQQQQLLLDLQRRQLRNASLRVNLSDQLSLLAIQQCQQDNDFGRVEFFNGGCMLDNRQHGIVQQRLRFLQLQQRRY